MQEMDVLYVKYGSFLIIKENKERKKKFRNKEKKKK